MDVVGRTVTVAHAGGTEQLEWDELVLATGARPRRLAGQPGHPRVRSFHTPEDALALRGLLETGQVSSAAVIGGGFVGCELAEAFRSLWGAEVELVEMAEWPLPANLDPEVGGLVAAALRDAGVTVSCGETVRGVSVDEERVRVDCGSRQVEADVAVVALGVEPVVGLARDAGIRLGDTGAIQVDERLATSAPHVWAAGDCVEHVHAVTGAPCHLPFGSLSNQHGRTVANILAGRDDKIPAVAGAMVVKVFESTVAAVGVSRAQAERSGLEPRSVWLAAHDCAHYWPEVEDLFLHLVYSHRDRRVLGVQAVGGLSATKRVDVATQVVARRGTIDELAHLEHCYAPPYAPAVDPLVVAAWAAQSQEEGLLPVAPDAPLGDRLAILDTRHPDEAESGVPAASAGVTVLPVEHLRRDADRLPPGPWVTVCARGGRSAEAARWLLGRGGEARYLGGGVLWRSRLEGQ